ncbi:MAG TPA: cyclic nucleotide-binding domain-containing protein, partial [Lacipirellulaceae bacterium]|nr:cyclic nucleotide-binding domain-containing protein [Lacipirellulaceae bacterium]
MELAITRPQRWNEPFGRMSDRDVDQLLSIEPFRSIDASAFPPSLPLRGILSGDTRLVRFEPGDVVVREGDYGNSAFLILDGTVRVMLERLDPQMLGRDEKPRRGWFRAIAQLWENAALPEVRPKAAVVAAQTQANIRDEDGTPRVFVQDVPRLVSETGTARLGRGELFGELAAMSRTPRTATVLADTRATLLEIRWQGLRDLMRRTPAIREHVERLYRENSLRVHLRETELLKNLAAPQLDAVTAATEFESFGNFDWYSDFSTQQKRDAAEQIAAEPLIAAEGDRATGLYLIRSGFARLSRRHGQGHRTLAYIGKGQVFGWSEFVAAFKNGGEPHWHNSLRAVGYVDVLHIPAKVVLETILPIVEMGAGDSGLGTGEDITKS